MWNDGDYYYEVDYAKTGRSKCREFRCKETIPEGMMRVGKTLYEENDHWGKHLGWYHPECLRKTFWYRKNGNKKIKRASEIKGYRSLDPVPYPRFVLRSPPYSITSRSGTRTNASLDHLRPFFFCQGDRDELDRVFNNKGKSASKGDSKKKSVLNVTVKCTGAGQPVIVTGDTYDIRAQLKDAGAAWSPSDKSWVIPGDCYQHAKELFNVTSFKGKTIRFQWTKQDGWQQKGGQNNSSSSSSTPKKRKASTSSTPGAGSDDGNHLKRLKVEDLRAMCRAAGVKTDGKKAELVARLLG
uniref:SAP domain-containing protein n=1 Tax=Lotharella globosa TaxID=91324 RepID=A0A7S3ZF71_9EUKA